MQKRTKPNHKALSVRLFSTSFAQFRWDPLRSAHPLAPVCMAVNRGDIWRVSALSLPDNSINPGPSQGHNEEGNLPFVHKPCGSCLFVAISLWREIQGSYVVFEEDPCLFLKFAKGEHNLSLTSLISSHYSVHRIPESICSLSLGRLFSLVKPRNSW